MHNLKELKILHKAIDLSVLIYKTTNSFPVEERYGLTNQIRRSVVSIASNISEGAGRNSTKDFINFLSIAQGSLYELETQLIIANKIDFLSVEALNNILQQISEIQKMNRALQKKLQETATV